MTGLQEITFIDGLLPFEEILKLIRRIKANPDVIPTVVFHCNEYGQLVYTITGESFFKIIDITSLFKKEVGDN